MPKIKLNEVTPGMILAEDVIHDGKNVLLNSGQVMNNQFIQMLVNRGISEILIQDQAVVEKAKPEKKVEEVKQAPKAITYPVVKPYITHDQMGANISIEPNTKEDQPLTVEIIKKALIDAGVVYGYQDNDIQNVIRRYNATREKLDNIQVAKGKMGVPGKQGEVNIVVPFISNNEDYNKATSAKYASDVSSFVREGMRVDAETIIAKRMDSTPPQPGTDVCGETVNITEIVSNPIKTGNNVESIKEDKQFKSTAIGVVCFIDKTLSVFPMVFDSKCELKISDDKMEAKLTVKHPSERGKPPQESDIESLLTENQIKYGVMTSEIQRVVRDARVGVYVEGLLIAKGEPPVNGEDGRLDFLFDVSGKAKPKTKEDGTVDYKNVKLVESANEGQELVRLLPPTQGKVGHNLLGEEIPFKEGTPGKLPTGKNTAVKDGDPNVLIATATGNVRYNGSIVEVFDSFAVKGDVDFSTGNIKYPKSVVIKGDIKSGFEVDVGGDLEIGGTVEDAKIECGGNVLIKCGFIGSGKGIINAKGNVTVAFLRNQEIKSRQDIFIAKEAVGAKLWSKNNIEAMGKPYSIAGGHISARNEIKAYAIGTENGTRTEVEVGMDFTLLEEQSKTDDKIKELNASRSKVMENLQKLRHIKQLRKNLQPKEEFLLKKLETMDEKINMQLDALEKRKQVISQKLFEVSKARIVIEHAVYPGTVIKIGERHMVVNKEIIGPKSIMHVKGEIKIV